MAVCDVLLWIVTADARQLYAALGVVGGLVAMTAVFLVIVRWAGVQTVQVRHSCRRCRRKSAYAIVAATEDEFDEEIELSL